MQTVCPMNYFSKCSQKMEAVFQTFSAHGSGWILQRVNEFYIKIGKVLLIRVFSFIPLPAKIAKLQQYSYSQ